MKITIRVKRKTVKRIKQILLGTVAIAIIGAIILNIRVAGIDENGDYFQTKNLAEVLTHD